MAPPVRFLAGDLTEDRLVVAICFFKIIAAASTVCENGSDFGHLLDGMQVTSVRPYPSGQSQFVDGLNVRAEARTYRVVVVRGTQGHFADDGG